MSRERFEEIEAFERHHSHRQWVYLNRGAGRIMKMFLYWFLQGLFVLLESLFACLVLLFVTLPIGLIFVIRKLLRGTSIFESRDIYGYKARKMRIWVYKSKGYWTSHLPLFLYVLTRKLSLTGVSIKQYDKETRVLGDAYLYHNKPGVFNLWYVRESSRIGHEGKLQIEWDYLFRRNWASDWLLILKTLPAILYYQEIKQVQQQVDLFGIEFQNIRMVTAMEWLNMAMEQKSQKSVYFINPDCLNKIFHDPDYYEVLRNADYVFPDGIGINIACKMLKNPLLENINGTDMLPFLCELMSARKYSLYLLGAKPGVAEQMKKNLESTYPNLKIVGVRNGYFDRDTESSSVINQINQSGADVLLVAFGAPHQEKWIDRYRSQLSPQILMGVGGLFDFYSGNISRAPVWMREVGLEWVYRLLQEPGRMWRRYIIGNPLFLYRVMKWKLSEGGQTYGNRS